MVSLAKVSISQLVKDVGNYVEAKNKTKPSWFCGKTSGMGERINKLKCIEKKYLQTNSTDKAIEIFHNRNEQDEDDEKYTCTICLVNPSDIALIPCGHTIMCESCARKMSRRWIRVSQDCPICRTPIRKKQKLYFS